jgi:hypothetical protein
MKFSLNVKIEVWQTELGKNSAQPDPSVIMQNIRARAERFVEQETHTTGLNKFWQGKGVVDLKRTE